MTKPIVDDRLPICLDFILKQLGQHRSTCPLIVGVNGLQGAGKTTLVEALATLLNGRGLSTLTCSIDDFYLDHNDLAELTLKNSKNSLLQHRGQPGTHDLALLSQFITSLRTKSPFKVPKYDKSALEGLGDRAAMSMWHPINQKGQKPLELVIFEGWCVGFEALSADAVQEKRMVNNRTLCKHKLEHLLLINENLKAYDFITDSFDAFVHIDAEDLDYVYDWRAEQEEVLMQSSGHGMTPDQVIRFVDGYFPSYELYCEGIRKRVFTDKPGCHLRIVVDSHRRVVETTIR